MATTRCQQGGDPGSLQWWQAMILVASEISTVKVALALPPHRSVIGSSIFTVLATIPCCSHGEVSVPDPGDTQGSHHILELQQRW